VASVTAPIDLPQLKVKNQVPVVVAGSRIIAV
jgi:hypothetical protein